MPAKRKRTVRSGSKGRRGRTDWDRVDRQTDDEIAAAVAGDPDAAPLLPATWFREATLLPPLTKKGVFLRLDPDVLAWFKAGGPGYQTRINQALRAFVQAHLGRAGTARAHRKA